MIVLFLILCLLSIGLILPGWVLARRSRYESPWLLGLPVVGLVAWVALTWAGLGAQSLANLVEVLGVALVAVAVAYIKIWGFDRSPALRPYGLAIAYGLVIGITLMPPKGHPLCLGF